MEVEGAVHLGTDGSVELPQRHGVEEGVLGDSGNVENINSKM